MTRIISDEEIFEVKYPSLTHLVNKSLWVTDNDRAIASAQRDNSDAEQFTGTEVQFGGYRSVLVGKEVGRNE